MKKILLFLTLIGSAAYAQQTVQISTAEYQLLKDQGALDPTAHYVFTDASLPTNIQYSMAPQKNGVCNCMVPLDSTFTLAMLPNDDESSAPVALPFAFDFYGVQYDTVIINNNGNVSFLAPYYNFVPNAFPDATFNMIAPFWADVDTRSANGGQVWYKLTPNAMIVIWNQVGYFAMHEDMLATFQLIISDGTDQLVPTGNNVSFCYDDMTWTTGDASGGIGGFGGSAATVGVNIGDGVNFFQVGQFDTSGVSFDGPYATADGVDFLDGQEVYFNVQGAASSNTPPLLISSAICDTIDIYTGDTLVKSTLGSVEFTFAVATPESNQVLNTSITCSAPDAIAYTANSVTPEFVSYDCEFTADGLSPGFYTITITSMDNGTPVGITTKEITVQVIYDEGLAVNELNNTTFTVFPNPTTGEVTVKLNESLSSAEVVVTDLTGKTMLTQTIDQLTILDVSHLAQGSYIVSIISNEVPIAKQVVVKQ